MKTVLQDQPRSQRLSLRFRAVFMVALIPVSGCAFLHKSPPYKDPDRLVSVVKVAPAGEEPVLDTDFLEWRNQSQTLSPIVAYIPRGFTLTDKAQSERIDSALVSADFFPLLGVGPILGRAMLPEEGHSGRNHVVVISHNLWQRKYGGDPSLIGKAMMLDQEKYTVIGIMPPDFQFPKECDVWAPLALDDERLRLEDKNLGLEVIARLKPGVSLQQAQTEMNVIARKLEKNYPETNNSRDVKIIPLSESHSQKTKAVKMTIRRPVN